MPVCKCGASAWDAEGRCEACRRFPTLGELIGEWIEAKCVVPDRDQVGEPFELTNEQWRFLLWFYRLNPHVTQDRRGRWSMPFVYSRGGQIVRPQKWGKGPFSGAIIAAEAAGPTVFDGWDAYGQPVGKPQPTPLVQVTASSEDQTDNVWMALLPMITLGDFQTEIPETGLKRIYLPNGGYIEPVTSSARSRLGQRVTFTVQDQTENWTEHNGGRKLADTQRRNIAGMGGRWLSTCNAWDPAEDSVAQITFEQELAAGDVFHDDVEPAQGLSIRNKSERKKALQQVYGDSWWVDLDRVDAEIVALMQRDPAQAERFFLNRKSAAESAAFDPDVVDKAFVDPLMIEEPEGRVVLGIDGARFADALAIVATDVLTGRQWLAGLWERPEAAPDDYEHPSDEIDGTFEELMATHDVWRAYIDPQYIEAHVERWQGRHGKKIVEWRTNRPRQIAHAVRAFTEDMGGMLKFTPSEAFKRHLKNARRSKVNVFDDKHVQMHTLAKDRPDSPRKMDAAMAGVISWEARGDCIAAGETERPVYRSAGFR